MGTAKHSRRVEFRCILRRNNSDLSAMKMHVEIHPILELMLLAGLACLGLGLAWAQGDSLFAVVFATQAGLAAIEAFYLSA